ncbi:MAG: hypothetical protein KAJ63_15495 [Methyloprofundus sp.]|nr:hypothetical protein [Methyloprofundus sp.]
MQRTKHNVQCSPDSLDELHKNIAFHEAGHVTAIYIRNHQQQLPPVFFQITMNKNGQKEYPFFARVESGKVIENLPVTAIEKNNFATEREKKEVKQAYEAKIINLFAGPLAEAKYVALRDDEIFTPYLVNIAALKNYGGHSDIDKASRYLEYFISNIGERELKIKSLFEQAFQFIDEYENWKCIRHFAHYLLDNGQSTITYEEASAVFEQFLGT